MMMIYQKRKKNYDLLLNRTLWGEKIQLEKYSLEYKKCDN